MRTDPVYVGKMPCPFQEGGTPHSATFERQRRFPRGHFRSEVGQISHVYCFTCHENMDRAALAKRIRNRQGINIEELVDLELLKKVLPKGHWRLVERGVYP